jgi:glycosyltransferase involved in cell wall biosynthesis
LVILNRNEAEALPRILPRLPLSEFDVVFAVDGNSTDDSPRILRDHKIHVVIQTSSGRGEAFRLAFSHAGEDIDALLFFSPDGNEEPADTRRFRPALESGADMVIASRMMAGAVNEEDVGWFRPRKWANIIFNWMAYLTWGRGQSRVTDGINGFRAITRAAWARLELDSSGYTIEYQSTIRAYKKHMRVSEFPTVEGARLGGQSDAKAIDTGLKFIRLYFHELFRAA